MKRKEAIKAGTFLMGAISMGGLSSFHKGISEMKNRFKMPVLFVGHGSPMNALEDNSYFNEGFDLGSISMRSILMTVK